MTVVLAGATGLVGRAFVRIAGEGDYPVTAVGRRDVEGVAATIRTDFSAPLALPPADVALCALGTTMATAGSRAAFYAVDHVAVLHFAQAALAAGIRHFIVISAVGADPRSPVFYSRVKGETERDLAALGFARLDILRPGLLLGRRRERRPGEALFQRLDPVLRRLLPGPLSRYAGIPAATVAAAMLALCGQGGEGTTIHHNAELRRLASAV
ncbi:NAD-dependent epimerase/dehydratase family protein [Pseudohaliea sp.]|uniref:NAD-dependent epimerase/dehydratase family protein n=1 Tax=Pseudohaliea sp. TaxID=2740289 RepID=UPI0032ECC9DF